jgi:hypothetical protein
VRLVKLRYVTGACKDGPCPTVYETDRGTFVVQGFVIENPEALGALQLPPGETAVEVPKDLLLSLTASGEDGR